MDVYIESKQDKIIKIIYVDGEFERQTTNYLKLEVDKILESGVKNILINFKNVRFMESTGIGTLVNIVKKGLIYKATIKFSNFSDRISKVLRLINLHKFFDSYKTEEEALRSF